MPAAAAALDASLNSASSIVSGLASWTNWALGSSSASANGAGGAVPGTPKGRAPSSGGAA